VPGQDLFDVDDDIGLPIRNEPMAKQRGSKLLKNERERRKLTQRAAAKELGLQQSYLSMYEAGKTSPSLKVAFQIQKRWGIPAETWV
jgi:transcriptional regulator with XRE-family HTH domain